MLNFLSYNYRLKHKKNLMNFFMTTGEGDLPRRTAGKFFPGHRQIRYFRV
ncbi:hypothetical protein HMPREF3033_01093 [Veillonellaceae bacterium DNF00751]|nr:hypothetical protein HMPREF3033_01093 [Veillonellaceae bacterium DNF00751]